MNQFTVNIGATIARDDSGRPTLKRGFAVYTSFKEAKKQAEELHRNRRVPAELLRVSCKRKSVDGSCIEFECGEFSNGRVQPLYEGLD